MQGPSRRQVCVGTALAGVSWALGACAPAGQPSAGAPPPERTVGLPSQADFRAIAGSTVNVMVDDSPRPLVVAAIHEHRLRTGKLVAPGAAFTVILDLAGASGTPIAPATYPAMHPELGPFTLFLVSHLSPGRNQLRYSATFSRS
jgi:hypothetical protein